MEIRTYQPADRESVVSLWKAVFPGSTGIHDPGDSIDRKLALDDSLLFVVVEEKQVIGAVMAGYDGHRGWIYSLAVHPEHQRRGIGRRLVHHAQQALKQLGCPKLNLQVRADNAEVVAFYESLGFQVEERISMGKLISA